MGEDATLEGDETAIDTQTGEPVETETATDTIENPEAEALAEDEAGEEE